MIKCRDNDMPLPYDCLITHLMLLYGINLMGESLITLGWNNFFGEKTMKKMNIFEVNGVWQLERLDNEHEQEHKDIPLPQEHVARSHPQPEIPHDSAMLTQIWVGIQNIQENINTVHTHLDRIKDTLHQLQLNEEH